MSIFDIFWFFLWVNVGFYCGMTGKVKSGIIAAVIVVILTLIIDKTAPYWGYF